MVYNIAIDGPAGAGKSTIAKGIARRLSFVYVDTGAMYRAMAFFLVRQAISLEDQKGMENACKNAKISISYVNGDQQVILNGENVTPYLRTEEVGNMASVSSANPAIRSKLADLQRELARQTSVVMDGRDIGTQVLPNANVKIYLTASAHTRALRRYHELRQNGNDCDLAAIEADINERDRRDMTREISPLCQAKDAVLVDSSQMSIEEVMEAIIAVYESKKQKAQGELDGNKIS